MDAPLLLLVFLAALLLAEVFRLGLVYLDNMMRRRRQQQHEVQMVEVDMEHPLVRDADIRDGSRVRVGFVL
ncbi:hypothetical protein HK57_00068 [Aspergillus ustus]|uniref:Uncharacterized protein n=1 Tax=Aspergillus ustus TaxID=40382 RepID=A0A0C1BV75_ASPUT|nr:hypothetical protein HK57_00068 [Aspergillus ustus]